VKPFESLRGKKIMLTGGAGFIGHNLALALNRLEAEVHVVDGLQVNNLGYYLSQSQSNPNSELYISFINERLQLLRNAGIKLNVMDVRDYHAITRVILDTMPDVVIHLAAIAHANRSNKDPFSTFDHSLRTLENVLDCISEHDIHLIFFSSSLVYGDFGESAATEDQTCKPFGIYGALKYGAEKLVVGYNQVFKMPYTIVRPSALYGERCVSSRVGQAFIENALLGKNLTINGDGNDSLDFTYIKDLIDGICRIIITPEARGEVFNLTYGSAQKISSLAQIVMEHFPSIRLVHKPRDILMPERGTLNIEKARKILGFKPTFSLEAGFERYIQWYLDIKERTPEFFCLKD